MLCVAAVFNLAIDNGQTKKPPLSANTVYGLDNRKKAKLSVEEIRSIFRAGGDRLVDMFLLMFLLIGINLGDLFALTKRISSVMNKIRPGEDRQAYSLSFIQSSPDHRGKYKGKKAASFLQDIPRDVDVATVMINKKLLQKCAQGLPYYARHSWASIAFNIGIQKGRCVACAGSLVRCPSDDTYQCRPIE